MSDCATSEAGQLGRFRFQPHHSTAPSIVSPTLALFPAVPAANPDGSGRPQMSGGQAPVGVDMPDIWKWLKPLCPRGRRNSIPAAPVEMAGAKETAISRLPSPFLAERPRWKAHPCRGGAFPRAWLIMSSTRVTSSSSTKTASWR